MRRGDSGNSKVMSDHEHRRRPTPNQPLNAEPRPRVKPILAVIALVVVILVVFAVITWVRYHGD